MSSTEGEKMKRAGVARKISLWVSDRNVELGDELKVQVDTGCRLRG